MHAIGFKPGSVDREAALIDLELPIPKAEGRDLLIEVKAVSVNPVDTKMRRATEPALRKQPTPDAWRVLGWDAAAVDREVSHYRSRVAAERESQQMPDDQTADAARLGAEDVRVGAG